MSKTLFTYLIAALLSGFFSSELLAQKTVKIKHADSWEHDPKISKAQRLIGNVGLIFENTLMYCDSAYLYPNEDFEAFGNIRIRRGDSLRMQAKNLKYLHNDSKLELREEIVMRNPKMTLTTDFLDYHIKEDVGTFFGGGVIVSKENKNRLKSERGDYFSKSDVFHFSKDVELKNDDFELFSDTMHYNNSTELTKFFGPTTILGDDLEIYCESGWFDSPKGICEFNRSATINSGSNILKGDSIYYEVKEGYGEAFNNVIISDTTSNYYVLGHYGRHNEISGNSLVTDSAQLVQIFGDDSLFLHADTLLGFDNDSIQKIIAYQNVKFYKSDMQGVADTMIYTENDSLLEFIGSPLIWSEQNQISGERIALKLWGGKIRELHIPKNAFIISEADSLHYNQIKGRILIGYFEENELRKIHVQGNGQTIYFPVEDGEEEQIMGMNKAECSSLLIYIKESELEKIVLLDKPDGSLLPEKEYGPEEMMLEDFFWSPERRPNSKEDIFNK